MEKKMGEVAAEGGGAVRAETVEKAVKALLKWRESESQTQKPQLLEQDEWFYVIVSLKKIPEKPRVNPHKVALPHPLVDPSSSELCLVIDDRPKSGLTKDAASKKIKSEEIPMAKIIKYSKLKSDYKPFEAKRKLCDSYDMFFADRRIIPLLPRLLGKHFFKKRKIPVPLDLGHSNWKEQIHRACSSALLSLTTGTCCVVKVARLSMGKNQAVENVIAAINGIADTVPSKWGNIRALHLKLLDSLALPLYQAVPDLRLKIVTEEVVEPEEEEEEEEEEDASSHQKKKEKKKNKGRIHEVQYMDENTNDTEDENKAEEDDDHSNKKNKTSAPKKLRAIDTTNAKDKDKKKKKKKKRKTLAAQ